MTRVLALLFLVATLIASCGDVSTSTVSATPMDLTVAPQNSAFLLGVGRVSFALIDAQRQPVLNAKASVDIPTSSGIQNRPIEFVGREYSQIPVYIGVASFDRGGDVVVTVHATYVDGSKHDGVAHITVATTSSQLAVGAKVPPVKQRIASDVGGDLSQIDTGVPAPDNFHTETIAAGLAEHKPMVLVFATPGRCVSRTCGPTVQIVQELQQAYGSAFLIEHIEPYDPAQSNTYNPAYAAFGLLSEPWVYFVNRDGVVADRFEGSLALDQLKQAADGTLADRVPAVSLS